ncbi:hypothetical protein T484DRAFT_1931707 [Baffinella frigidus]|nr:hypothetical protein T484DRAFT_1931707 [Cryptophyta sp. CCMP2293]
MKCCSCWRKTTPGRRAMHPELIDGCSGRLAQDDDDEGPLEAEASSRDLQTALRF